MSVKLLVDLKLPYTLEYVKDFQKGQPQSSKFGGKYSKYMLSWEKEHEHHNKIYWIEKAEKLRVSESVMETGFFKDKVKKAVERYKNESTEKVRREELIDALKEECETVHTDFQVKKPNKENQPKWKEAWTYCSVDGEEHWS